MNSKITKLKTSEATKGFMGKLMLTYFILVVLNLIITYLLVDKLTYTASIVSTIISTLIFCVMTLGIKSIFKKSKNANFKESIPSLSFFLNSLGINVVISLINGVLFVLFLIVLFIVLFAILPTTSLSDFLTGTIIYSDSIPYTSTIFNELAYSDVLFSDAAKILIGFLFIFCLLILPLTILISSFISNITALAIYAVLCEDNTNLIEAFSFGFKSVFGNFKYFLLLSLYFSGLMLLAAITCGLSLIYTTPRTMCVQYQAYIELAIDRNNKDDFEMF